MKRKHIIILSAFVVAIIIALLGSKTVVHSSRMLVKDSLINVRDVTITELDSELKIIDTEIGNLKSEYSELESTNYSMKSQLVMMERNLESAKNELNNSDVEKQQAMSKIQTLQQQILQYTGSDAYLQEIIKKKDATIERLKREKNNLEIALNKEKSKNQTLTSQVRILEKQIIVKKDSIILLASELDVLYKDPNYVGKNNQIAQLKRDKAALNKTISSLKGNINEITENIPPIYNANAYYYALIKKQVPGKIMRVKDTIKFYLDKNDDYAKNLSNIYFSFEINSEIFFQKHTQRDINFNLTGGSITSPMRKTESFSMSRLSLNTVLFPNVTLATGDYKIAITFSDTGEKVIDDYLFTLQ